MYKVQHITNKRKIIRNMDPEYLTIHSTGNPSSTAQNERDNLNRPDNTSTTGFHIVVDDLQAIECIPLNKVAYHAGDGANGTGNNKSIGLEICESGNRSKAIENAVEVAAKILHQYNWGIDKLKRHYDWSGKNCPRILSANNWKEWEVFKTKVQAHLNLLSHDNKATGKLYRVQVGAYSNKSNAEKMLNDLKLAGFNGIIKEESEIIPEKPEIIIPNKKSLYIEKGNAKIIKTRPDNIAIEVLGDTLHGAKKWGVNGTFFDLNTAPVENPESCVFVAMNEGKAISNNAQFNGWNGPPRATLIYHNYNKIGFRQLQNINPIRDITNWAIGGYMVKPYMDFKNEGITGSVNYKTNHTYIGADADENIYLIVKPSHMIHEIVPLLNELGITSAIVLDGGGSSQLNHPQGHFKSTRRINTAIVLKEV